MLASTSRAAKGAVGARSGAPPRAARSLRGAAHAAVHHAWLGRGNGMRSAVSLRAQANGNGAASAAAAAGATPGVPLLPPSQAPVLVLFKHDLRMSDHPGLLAAAASGAPVIPFFCLDPRLYAHLALTPSGPEALLAALQQLRASLRALGSDLVVRLGPAHFTSAAFAGLAGVGRIVMEREEESRWLEAGHRLSQQLASMELSTAITTWQAPLWPAAAFTTNFKAWSNSRGQRLVPLPPPAQLPPLPEGLEPGQLPSLESLKSLLAQNLAAAPAAPFSASAAAAAAGSSSSRSGAGAGAAAAAAAVIDRMLQEPQQLGHSDAVAALVAAFAGSETDGSSSGSSSSSSGGQALSAEALLRAYLVAEGSAPAQQQLAFLRRAVEALEGPAAPGASFPALMGPLIGLGVLSSRQVATITTEVEAARWGGRLPPFGPATSTAKAALAAVELSDFHRQLAAHIPQEGDEGAGGPDVITEPVASASSSYDEGPDGVQQWGLVDWPAGVPRRCNWRWRGALTDYCVVQPSNPLPGRPPLVLVHGFGAFGDQWRGNLGALAAAGYTVYAPTLPGFGRSEKAALQYSQNAWRDFIRDFLVCVVGQPAVIAGNSIGGFICASAAADYPSLVAGLVLINAAGPITPGASAASVAAEAAAVKKAPNPLFVKLMTAGLMAYLSRSIAKQLKWLYPTNPDAADGWLEREIYRAACDARSADVFASVFYLPKPRPLNFLINELWKGPTAVVQGVLDPLNDAAGRAEALRSLCPGTRVWALQAGHCPHDEQPGQVNEALVAFVEEEVVVERQAKGQQEAASNGGGGEAAVAVAAAAGSTASG